MRKIGDRVLVASFGTSEKWIPCTDCGGAMFAIIEFATGERVSIECPGCRIGYDPSSGVIRMYVSEAKVELATIKEIRQGESKIEYTVDKVSGYSYIHDESDVFGEEEPAQAQLRAQVLALANDEEQRKRIESKEKPLKTWAWNASYHRREIERLEKDLVYHRKKLDAAAIHKSAEKNS